MLYHSFLSEQAVHSSVQLYQLCEKYHNLSPREMDTPETRILHTLEQAAVATAILQVAALQLGVESNPENVINSWPRDPINVVDTIKQILGTKNGVDVHSPNGAIRNAQVRTIVYKQHHQFLIRLSFFRVQTYFLQRLDPQTLVSLLTTKAPLDTLGLNNWLVTNNVGLPSMSKFSFMLETKSDYGKQYSEYVSIMRSSNINALKELLARGQQNETVRYRLRMFTVLILYYEYFKKGIACEFYKAAVQQGVTAPLGFTAEEQTAINFLANAPQDLPQADEIAGRFSLQAMQAKKDLEMCDIMVSCLAVALGSPPESNHLYSRIFRPKELTTTSCPGSDYHRLNYDCGFQLTNDFNLTFNETNPSIMGGNKRCRLTLNVITWACWCWPLLLNPDEQLAQYWNHGTQTHFLNALNYEYYRPNASLVEKTRAYVLRRSQAFLNMLCNDAEILTSHVNSVHYITESLLQLWRTIHSNKQPPAFKNTKTKDEAVAYENEMQKLFDAVLSNYSTLKDAYLGEAMRVKAISTITQVQNLLSQRYSSPMIGFDIVEARLTTGEAQKLPFLEQFLRSLPSLKILKYIPRLVFFYDLLNNLFGHRLTRDDIRLPVLQCLEKVKDLEPAETIERFKRLWVSFKNEWKILKEEMHSLRPVCPDQAVNRPFESQIIDVDDTTPLAVLITESKTDGMDAIINVIKSIDLQRTLLDIRSKHYQNMNHNGLLFEEGPVEMPASQLPAESEANRYFFGSDWDQRDWQAFAEAHVQFGEIKSLRYGVERKSLRVDFARIERQMLEKSACKVRSILK